jgi:hypothetical protein
MTDEQLAAYLGIADHPERTAVIARMSPARRKSYERMAQLEIDVDNWLSGSGQKPSGVLLDFERPKRKY